MRNPSIPNEIIFDIFAWLPVRSLMRFKCVARFCKELDFTGMHRSKFILHDKLNRVFYTIEQKGLGKASIVHKFNYVYDDQFNYVFDDRPGCPHFVCVSGLFCLWKSHYCESTYMLRAAIFNPSTREVRCLPNLNSEYPSVPAGYALGFEPEEKKYKVLLATWDIQAKYPINWVFTVGTDKSWREIKSISNDILPWMAVCISGVLYLFSRQPEYSIAAFDIKSEKFKIVTLWPNPSRSNEWSSYKLMEVKGKLAVMDCDNWMSGYNHLWILDNTQWVSQIIHFPLQVICKDFRVEALNYYKMCMSCDVEILFIVKIKLDVITCLYYDISKESWSELEIEGIPARNSISGISSYVESLIPLIEK